MSDKKEVDLILEQSSLARTPITQVDLDLEDSKQTILIPKQQQHLTEEDIDDAYDLLESVEIIRSAPFYEDWKNGTKAIWEKIFIDYGVAHQITIATWIALLERWQDKVNAMSDYEQYQRFRKFNTELITYEITDNSYVVKINSNALLKFIEDFALSKDQKMLDSWVNYAFDSSLAYCLQDIFKTPEQNKLFFEKVQQMAIRHNKPLLLDEDFEPGGYGFQYAIMLRLSEMIGNFSSEDFNAVASGFISQVVCIMSEVTTLDGIERKVLRFTYPIPKEQDSLIISRGDVPVAIHECLVGAIAKTWKEDQDRSLCYEAFPFEDGLTLKMLCEDELDGVPQGVLSPKNIIDGVNQLTLNLHRLLQIQAEQQEAPWQGNFKVSISWLLENMNLGRLSRKSQKQQIEEITKHLLFLQSFKIQIGWQKKDASIFLPISGLWHFEFQNQIDTQELTSLTDFTVSVMPGKWVAQCNAEVNKCRNLLWIGYQPKNSVTQRTSLKSHLEAVYYQSQQNEFTIKDWLVRAESNLKLEQQLKDRYKKKDLKKAVNSAISQLKDTVYPRFEIEINPDNWFHSLILKKIPKVEPVPISQQIRDLRSQLRLTQSEVAKKVGYSRSRIAQLECGTLPNEEAAARIHSMLSELLEKNINIGDVKR